jgi:hypothetical protein
VFVQVANLLQVLSVGFWHSFISKILISTLSSLLLSFCSSLSLPKLLPLQFLGLAPLSHFLIISYPPLSSSLLSPRSSLLSPLSSLLSPLSSLLSLLLSSPLLSPLPLYFSLTCTSRAIIHKSQCTATIKPILCFYTCPITTVSVSILGTGI